MSNELITSDQLAEELGVKPQTVRLWRTKTRRGRPSGPKWTVILNNTIRYNREDIEDLLHVAGGLYEFHLRCAAATIPHPFPRANTVSQSA